MDGPSHYREAERLLGVAAAFPNEPVAQSAYDSAQIHATLALAAATALRTLDEFYEVDNDAEAWLKTASVGVSDEDQADDPAHTDGALDRIAGHALTGSHLDQTGGAV